MPEETTVKKDTATAEKTSGEVNVGMAVLAYIIFLIPLLTDAKNDPFVKFHIKQAIVLVVFAIGASVISSIIPVIGWFILGPITTIISLVLGIMGILNALNKQQKELPLIGKFAEQYLKF